jgi:hypothetical protein
LKTTDKQAAANRRNAARSTGPATPSGKAMASRNALKHGLLAKEIVIDAGEGAESREEFNAVVLDLRNQFDPQGPLEEMLVEKIAVAYWRLRRVHRYEAGLIRRDLDSVAEEYYKPPDRYETDSRSNRPDKEINAKIQEVKESQDQCRSDQRQLTKMREKGCDLAEIYDREDGWNALYDELPEEIDDWPEDWQPVVRQAAREAGWTDDQIWQFHIDECARELPALEQTIQELEQEKQKNADALQVRRQLASIPVGHEMDHVLKYEGAIERQFYKAIDQLERLQRLRAGDQVPAPVKIDVSVDTENPE